MALPALRVALGQLPAGTCAAAALAAVLRPVKPCSPVCPALAVAARQQLQGTPAASVLAAAAGRAFLRISRNTSASQNRVRSRSQEVHQQSSLPYLCQDTATHIFGQLWPAVEQHKDSPDRSCGSPDAATISPRTFETRLRMSKLLFNDLGHAAAVSPTWAKHAENKGWPSTHAYLFQESGTKGQLQERYMHSMRRLLVKDFLQSCGAPPPFSIDLQGNGNGVANHIAAFLP